jgi:hypothetical protein
VNDKTNEKVLDLDVASHRHASHGFCKIDSFTRTGSERSERLLLNHLLRTWNGKYLHATEGTNMESLLTQLADELLVQSASFRSVKYPFARPCLTLGSRSVPMYSSRKSSRIWTLGVSRVGP